MLILNKYRVKVAHLSFGILETDGGMSTCAGVLCIELVATH